MLPVEWISGKSWQTFMSSFLPDADPHLLSPKGKKAVSPHLHFKIFLNLTFGFCFCETVAAQGRSTTAATQTASEPLYPIL